MEWRRCKKCSVWLLQSGGIWFEAPLAHGPGSGALMSKKSICYTKWIFFEYRHQPGEVVSRG